jgi:integration host factor subunit alpha
MQFQSLTTPSSIITIPLLDSLGASRVLMATNGKTLTRADLAEAVFQKVGLPRNESSELVESVIREMITCLERGENVKLSSFGSFGVRDKRERVGRNPKTGETVPITPRRVLVFRASNIMKERINAALTKNKGRG